MKKYIEFIRTKNFVFVQKQIGGFGGFLYSLLIDSGGDREGVGNIRLWLQSDEEDDMFNEIYVEKMGDNIEIRWAFELGEPDASYSVISRKFLLDFLDKWLELIKTEHGVLKVTDNDGIIFMELTEGDPEYNTPDILKK